jgi:hypothetical protein
VEGILDYLTFYTMLQDQDKPVVVCTLGSYLTPAAANILKDLTFPRIVQPSLLDFFYCAASDYISMILNDMGIFPSMLRLPQKFEFRGAPITAI